MVKKHTSSFQLVDGVVFHKPRNAVLSWLCWNASLVPLGLVLPAIAGYFVFKDGVHMLVFPILMGPIGAVIVLMGVSFVWQHGFSLSERLIIGRDRIQMVTGKDKVVCEIPYDNMESADTFTAAGKGMSPVETINVDIIDPDRADTRFLYVPILTRRVGGAGAGLGANYEKSADFILEELNRRFEAYKAFRKQE